MSQEFTHRQFDLGKVSTYRTELMGVATLMIIFCHAPANGVQMPVLFERLIRWGGIGVDIFLFLSGVGMYYSLQKKRKLGEWYCHRFLRILVPFLFFSIPYYIFRWFFDNDGIWHFLGNITTLSFWTRHEGAWFVAMLIPLYLLTPWLAYTINRWQKRYVPTLALCALSVLGSMIPTHNEVIRNIQMCLGHIPSFFLGYWIGKYVQSGVRCGRKMCILGASFLFVTFFVFALLHIPKNWLIVLPLLAAFVVLFDINPATTTNTVFSFLGMISLESYLTNIYLPVVMRKLGIKVFFETIEPRLYLYYLIIIVIGISLAYLGHMASKRILKALSSF